MYFIGSRARVRPLSRASINGVVDRFFCRAPYRKRSALVPRAYLPYLFVCVHAVVCEVSELYARKRWFILYKVIHLSVYINDGQSSLQKVLIFSKTLFLHAYNWMSITKLGILVVNHYFLSLNFLTTILYNTIISYSDKKLWNKKCILYFYFGIQNTKTVSEFFRNFILYSCTNVLKKT